MRIFATAADSTHEKSLLQFLRSLRSHHVSDRVICFDMGMTPSVRKQVAELAEVRQWRFSPHWTDIVGRARFRAGAYAWKPQMIAMVALHESPGELAWLDAGTFVNAPLMRAFEAARKHGIYSPASRGITGQWCHSGMLSKLRIAPWARILGTPCRSAGAAFFDLRNPDVLSFVFEWLRLSLDPDIIAPPGCHPHRHRYDQSLFNLLFASRGFLKPDICNCCLDFAIQCDID